MSYYPPPFRFNQINYTGDGTGSRILKVGFSPKFMIILNLTTNVGSAFIPDKTTPTTAQAWVSNGGNTQIPFVNGFPVGAVDVGALNTDTPIVTTNDMADSYLLTAFG